MLKPETEMFQSYQDWVKHYVDTFMFQVPVIGFLWSFRLQSYDFFWSTKDHVYIDVQLSK